MPTSPAFGESDRVKTPPVNKTTRSAKNRISTPGSCHGASQTIAISQPTPQKTQSSMVKQNRSTSSHEAVSPGTQEDGGLVPPEEEAEHDEAMKLRSKKRKSRADSSASYNGSDAEMVEANKKPRVTNAVGPSSEAIKEITRNPVRHSDKIKTLVKEMEQSFETEIQKLRADNSQYKKNLASERGKNTRLGKMIAEKEREITDVKAKLQKSERNRKDQSMKFAGRVKDAPVSTEDEGVLVKVLKKLETDTKGFSEKYAISPETAHNIGPWDRQRVLKPLREHGAVSEEGEETIFRASKGGEILLNAVINHTVWHQVLFRPFYFFEYADQVGAPPHLEVALKWLHENTAAGNTTFESNSYTWQATIAQALKRILALKKSESESTCKAKLVKLQSQSFETLRILLENSTASVLRPLKLGDTEDRGKELIKILITAGNLSLRLWAQGYKLSENGSMDTFSIDSLDTKPHPTMLLDEDDKSKDGWPIDLIVKPGLAGYGNGDGKNIDVRRVLDRACVWMGCDLAEQLKASGPTCNHVTTSEVARSHQQADPISTEEGRSRSAPVSDTNTCDRKMQPVVAKRNRLSSTETAIKEESSDSSPSRNRVSVIVETSSGDSLSSGVQDRSQADSELAQTTNIGKTPHESNKPENHTVSKSGPEKDQEDGEIQPKNGSPAKYDTDEETSGSTSTLSPVNEDIIAEVDGARNDAGPHVKVSKRRRRKPKRYDEAYGTQSPKGASEPKRAPDSQDRQANGNQIFKAALAIDKSPCIDLIGTKTSE